MTTLLAASVASSLLFVVSMGWYLLDILKGRVVVSVVTFLILAIINISQTLSLFAEALYYQIPFSAIAFVVNFVICVVSLRSGRYRFRLLDKVVLCGALLGVVVWIVTDNAAYNIYILTLVVLISIVPLVKKTLQDPSTETRLPWVLNLGGSLLLLLTIPKLSLAAILVPARQLIFSGLMNVALRKRPMKQVD